MLTPVDGSSLRPLFTAELATRAKPLAFHHQRRAAWIDNRYKLMLSDRAAANPAKVGGKRDVPEAVALYDLIDDPREERNLAARPPEIVARMTAELHAWQRSVERSLSGADY